MTRIPRSAVSLKSTRKPATRSRFHPASFPSNALMSPASLASPLMARRRAWRGSGASDLTNSSTWGAIRTSVFIQTFHALHFSFAGFELPDGAQRLRIGQNLHGFDHGLDAVFGDQKRSHPPVARHRHHAPPLGFADDSWRLGLQLGNGNCRIHIRFTYIS